MTFEDLAKVVDSLDRKTRQTLDNRNQVYNPFEEDALNSFKHAADILQTTPEQALLGYAVKHISALVGFVSRPESVSFEQWEEKIGDIMNYMRLLYGLIVEAYFPDRIP